MFEEPVDVLAINYYEIDVFLYWVWTLKKIEFFLLTWIIL